MGKLYPEGFDLFLRCEGDVASILQAYPLDIEDALTEHPLCSYLLEATTPYEAHELEEYEPVTAS